MMNFPYVLFKELFILEKWPNNLQTSAYYIIFTFYNMLPQTISWMLSYAELQ